MIFIFSCFFFSYYIFFSFFFFFFQAEDGIRDGTVTGVQTCALPISRPAGRLAHASAQRHDDARGVGQPPHPTAGRDPPLRHRLPAPAAAPGPTDRERGLPPGRPPAVRQPRSEERRVGKACRSLGGRS